MVAPVESDLTLQFIWCVLMLLSKSVNLLMLSGNLLCLLKASDGQTFQLNWGNICLLWKGPPVLHHHTGSAQIQNPRFVHVRGKIFRRRVHAVKKIFRTNPGFQSQVQPDLHDSAAAPSSFSCISKQLAPSCKFKRVFCR